MAAVQWLRRWRRHLANCPSCAGEFTRRAFANGRIDLAEAEGLADLLAAETEIQRRSALMLAGGTFSRQVEGWRERLLVASAALEAVLDFADEDDADQHIADAARTCHAKLAGRSISAALAAGEYQVAYACGLQINLGLDAELRRVAPSSDGLFSVWRDYRDRVAGRTPTYEDFYAAIAKVGSPAIADFVRASVNTPATPGGAGSGQW